MPQAELLLQIDPSWPEERLFQHYRARLKALQQGAATASSIADFRRANCAIETRLRTSLPDLIKQIDAIYAWAATNAA